MRIRKQFGEENKREFMTILNMRTENKEKKGEGNK